MGLFIQAECEHGKWFRVPIELAGTIVEDTCEEAVIQKEMARLDKLLRPRKWWQLRGRSGFDRGENR